MGPRPLGRRRAAARRGRGRRRAGPISARKSLTCPGWARLAGSAVTSAGTTARRTAAAAVRYLLQLLAYVFAGSCAVELRPSAPGCDAYTLVLGTADPVYGYRVPPSGPGTAAGSGPRSPRHGVASPDDQELLRLACRGCGFRAAAAIWCFDPQCCDQDPGRFIGSLVSAGEVRGMPVFAVRYLDRAGGGSPADEVTVWRAGDLTPVFAGPAADAIRFQLRHECPSPQPLPAAQP